MIRLLTFLVFALLATSVSAQDWVCVATGSFDTCKTSPAKFCVPTVEVETVSAAIEADARGTALNGCQTDLNRKIGQVSSLSTVENVRNCSVTGCSSDSDGDGGGGDVGGGDGGNDNGGSSSQCRSVPFDLERRMISDAFSSFRKAVKQARSTVKRGASAEVSSSVIITTKSQISDAAKELARIGEAIFVDCSVPTTCRLSGDSGIAASIRKSSKRASRSAAGGLKRVANSESQRENLRAALDNLKSALDEVPGNSGVCR